MTHVIILDGTMSSLQKGCETNAGLIYKLLAELPVRANVSLRYEPGIQWRTWHSLRDVITGKGLNGQIQRAYGALASRYRRGDRIFMFGYSRGAYAVRSLAGVIDRVGLVRADHATARTVARAYRHYRDLTDATAFSAANCHEAATVEMIGVFDTVKALGLRAPLLWRDSDPAHEFHNHELGQTTRNGFHALALNETRRAYDPILWDSTPDFTGTLKQMWFRGTHGDIGGHQLCRAECRPLANIPLTWMLEQAEECALALPNDWRARFQTDPEAPSIGNTEGWGKFILNRAPRIPGHDPSEAIHPTAR
ncbi:DUF2235 domain-containing protein [Oceaniglobus ichthyenteri]|uniref:DUF2235 domain-containing protein n=1 Tax=Oceaniglobus ichthyenteri TaxID=2136177 RepID=UPI001F0CDB5E|nr:DUF2235 domain-containing protein [Oceaniglobus ichthyenteri]